ncbi:myotubularin-related protein 14-like isoform X1 [Topomyia yanbarensis]|uniref:myotubularin-related protein 14-like isoform X1 n=1 Tax=Topomyia yanbarensis TaxID=2498891 RepID=UPI00273C2C5F|nr:myotubularin-related protein 14-like isoform X1 [Topomyia yanbarensis]
MSEILQQDIQQLLEYFAKNLYRAKECEVGDEIVQRCSVLMRMDYTVTELTNPNGELSAHYPAKLLIPEQETKANVSLSTVSPATITERRPRSNASPQSIGSDAVTDSARNAANRDQVIVDGRIDAQRLRYLILRARLARCRARFPLPVILYKGKYICRSATLSGGPEIYGRSGLEYFAYAAEATLPEPGDEAYEAQEDSSSDESDSKDWPLFGRLRRKDIRLLKALNVGTIIDFMVENKKVKFWLNVTSSEKVDKENRYSFFKILALPYPGCEFFREYRDNDCRGEGLIFDWNQSYVDAGIRVPDDAVTAELNIDWHNYKQWDLVKLTQNYLRLLLKYLQENNSGLLVHCISGWDRTPLFVSLLRISLWADGAVHQSLSASQMLYFTIAYDWLLFGHNLPDRLNKGEVIFYFCFYILKYIVDDEFSVLTHRTRSHHSSGSSSIGVIRTDSESMLDGLLFDGESRGSSISLNSTCSFTSGRSSSIHDTQTCVSTGIGLTNDGASNSIAITGRNNGANRNSGTSGGATNGDEGINSFNGNNGFSSHSNDSSSSIGCMSHDSSNHNIQWSPKAKRTSPVTVPSAERLLRQRQESTSSLSVGSWQMITCTGSYRSAESVNEMQSHLQPNPAFACPNHLQRQQTQGHQQPHSTHPQSHQQQHHLNPGSGPPGASTPNANQHHSQETSCCTVIDGEYFPNRVDLYALRREKLTQLRTLFYNCYFSTIAFKFNSGPDSALGSLLGNFAEKVGLASRTPV